VVPNDSINGIEVEDFQGRFLFRVWIDSVDEAANHTEVHIDILAEGLHIEDTKRRRERVE
jgi:hypothetical protein